MTEGGSGLPSSLVSAGLGSKRSSWLGAPAMNRWITRLALGAKWGDLGARGFWPGPGTGEPDEVAREGVGQEAGQRDLADADAAFAEEMAAGCGFGRDEHVLTVMALPFGNGLVEIQQHPRQDGPGRAFVGVALAGAGDPGGVELLELEPSFLCLKKRDEL